MAAVQPFAMQGFSRQGFAPRGYSYEQEPLSGSDSEDEQEPLSGPAKWLTTCCFCTCCCFCCHFISTIIPFVASIGYLSCPAAAPQLEETSSAYTMVIPPHHLLIHNYYQGSSLSSSSASSDYGGRGFEGMLWEETNLYNPDVSNTTRYGYWRDTETWYGRRQWAYLVEGSDKPAAIAWGQWLSWMDTYEVQWCFPPKQYQVSEEHIWFMNWGTNVEKYSIYENGVLIAKSESRKEWSQIPVFGQEVPNTWHSVITSTLQPGTVLATTNQIIDGWFTDKESWEVDTKRPDLLEPYVASFMSVEAIQRGGGGRGGKR